MDEYFKTSAKMNEGVDQLFTRLLESIKWKELPRISTPRLFQVVRDFLLEQKENGVALISMDAIQQEINLQQKEQQHVKPQEIDTVVALLQARGLVHLLEPRQGMTTILTRPELINQYASSIVLAAKKNPEGNGAVLEIKAIKGEIPLSGFERLPVDQELIVLQATIELLIKHDLCIREMGYLIFPSEIRVTRPGPEEGHPSPEVTYRFSGDIDNVYASLVVSLGNTDYFRREGQWKHAIEFSCERKRLGFSMHEVEEGTGELEIYFDPEIGMFDRVAFIHFVHEHLKNTALKESIVEEIRLYCPRCGREVENREAVEIRIKEKIEDIPCQYCSTSVPIPRSIKDLYEGNLNLAKTHRKLLKTAEQQKEKIQHEFMADQKHEHFVEANDHLIHILHLSDIHMEREAQAKVFLTQLETDLKQNLKIGHLNYLVISGDISNYATEEEYDAAYEMVNRLVQKFGLNSDRVIIAPGNHDVNWHDSEDAYKFVARSRQPPSLSEGTYFQAGDAGILLRDKMPYQKRFANFSAEFYKKVCGKDYPLDYAQQAMLFQLPEDRIIFLSLNSSWQIDHHFKKRSGINMNALSDAPDRLLEKNYDGWLKIAVWHHPTTGSKAMSDEFMELLVQNNFQICMHGHIHEADKSLFNYDDKRDIKIIGAGTFGAPAKDQIPGIPLQYNLLTLDPTKNEIIVNTRMKDKPDGAWAADARWGDKIKDPKAWYRIKIENYQPEIAQQLEES